MVVAVIAFLSLVSVLVVTSADLSSRSRIRRIRAHGGPDIPSGGGTLADIQSLSQATFSDGSKTPTDHKTTGAAGNHNERAHEKVWIGYTLGSNGQKNAARHAEPMGKRRTDREQYKKAGIWGIFAPQKAAVDPSPQNDLTTGNTGGSNEAAAGVGVGASTCTETDGTCHGGHGKTQDQRRDAKGGERPPGKEGAADKRSSGEVVSVDGASSAANARTGSDAGDVAGTPEGQDDDDSVGTAESGMAEPSRQKERARTSGAPDDMQILLNSINLPGEYIVCVCVYIYIYIYTHTHTEYSHRTVVL
jgi:hypothetical protein